MQSEINAIYFIINIKWARYMTHNAYTKIVLGLQRSASTRCDKRIRL